MSEVREEIRILDEQGQSPESSPEVRTCKNLGAFREGKSSSAVPIGVKKTGRRIHGPRRPRI